MFKCPYDKCDWKCNTDNKIKNATLLQIHIAAKHQQDSLAGQKAEQSSISSSALHHYVFSKSSQTWYPAPPRRKPLVDLIVTVDHSAAARKMTNASVRTPETLTRGMPDTGASVCLGGPNLLKLQGLTEADLIRCNIKLFGADNSDIKMVGVLPMIITDTKTMIETRQMVYFCKKACTLLLSLEACIGLGYVSDKFPHAQCDSSHSQAASNSENKTGKNPECDCKCPERERAPDVPAEIPFDPIPENVPKLEQWIRDYYAASAFNCCECQPLPDMHGPPVKIHLTEDAKPVASHSPIPVPLHWQKKVKAGLDRDVAIGVLEKVPAGTPTNQGWSVFQRRIAHQGGQ